MKQLIYTSRSEEPFMIFDDVLRTDVLQFVEYSFTKELESITIKFTDGSWSEFVNEGEHPSSNFTEGSK